MKGGVLALVLSASLCFAAAASADNIARDYIPAPPGTLANFLYYTRITSDTLYVDGDKVNEDLDLTYNLGLLREVYFTKIGPFVIDPQFILPFGDVTYDPHSGTGRETDSGIGDLQLLATTWFVNEPESKLWLGFTPFVFVPIGSYDNQRAVNLGNNRWQFRVEADLVKGFDVMPGHPIYFEFLVGADFYTDNDDYGSTSAKLEQDPRYNFEYHMSYDVTRVFWISGDYYYHYGAETSLDGVDQNDEQSNHTVGVTFNFALTPEYHILAQYLNDVSVKSGFETQQVLIRFLYVTDWAALVGDGRK